MNFFTWLGKALEEAPDTPSTTRLVVFLGTMLILTTICGGWLFACIKTGALVEIPASVGATLGSYLLTLLSAKVIQRSIENPSDKSVH